MRRGRGSNRTHIVTVGSRTDLARTGPLPDAPLADEARPRTRGECPPVRPCPFVGCRYHLGSDEVGRRAKIVTEWLELPETCALDLVERHPDGMQVTEIGDAMGVSKQAIDITLRRAMRKVRAVHGRMVWHLDRQGCE